MSDTEMVTPKGVAIWPKLTSPDTKFNPLGVYQVDLAVPFEEAEGFMKKLAAIHKDHTGKVPAKAENTMWKMEIDEETGDETGRVIFKCKIKNIQRKDGTVWDRKPVLWDAKGNRIQNVNMGSGTVMRLKISVYAWMASGKKGVSLQPLQVQVIELKEFTGGGESFAFDVVEDGFAVDENNNNMMDAGDLDNGYIEEADDF